MPRFVVPTNPTLHAAHHFLASNDFFNGLPGGAELVFHPRWMHLEPLALVMIAAWSGWSQRQGMDVRAVNLSSRADYASRMRLFDHIDSVDHVTGRAEHDEAGRFLPVTNVRSSDQARSVLGAISALLHLEDDPESLAAVQYCVSELLRNVLEHSGSPEGAYVCAQNYSRRDPKRVSIAVADCGGGIASHLGRAHSEALVSDVRALQLALQPGVTGALPGIYGSPDNAGAGLFITRCLAKGTGGYFLVYSGNACYRLRRARRDEEQAELLTDPLEERHDLWELPSRWNGTVVSIEIMTDRIAHFESYFQVIRERMSRREGARRRVRFT